MGSQMKIGIIGGTAFEDPGALICAPVAESFVTAGKVLQYFTGQLDGADIEIVYVRRHDENHSVAPHQVPYNLHAYLMRTLEVDAVLGTAICGSLNRLIPPETIIIPDQLVDLTGRQHSKPPWGAWRHLPFGEPYCPVLRSVAVSLSAPKGITVRMDGCIATIAGPRFATRAESVWMARQGWDLVNMTQASEAYAMRDAGLCYVCAAFVTDFAYGLNFSDSHTIDGTMSNALESFRAIVGYGPSYIINFCREILEVAKMGACRCRHPMPAEYYQDS